MRQLRLVLEYDGTQYSGWQFQPNAITIQQVLQEKLDTILGSGSAKRLFASGRTDAGVHALAQVVTFTTDHAMEPEPLRNALNGILPHDISVRAIDVVPPSFDVMRDAVGKLYRYRILSAPARSSLRHDRVWWLHAALDVDAMQAGAEALRGEHDFASFQTGSDISTTVRDLSRLDVTPQPAQEELWIEAYSNGFLRGMVRNLVGALVEVGRGRLAVDELPRIIEARDRRIAPRSAPARGLYLVRVDYGP